MAPCTQFCLLPARQCTPAWPDGATLSAGTSGLGPEKGTHPFPGDHPRVLHLRPGTAAPRERREPGLTSRVTWCHPAARGPRGNLAPACCRAASSQALRRPLSPGDWPLLLCPFSLWASPHSGKTPVSKPHPRGMQVPEGARPLAHNRCPAGLIRSRISPNGRPAQTQAVPSAVGLSVGADPFTSWPVSDSRVPSTCTSNSEPRACRTQCLAKQGSAGGRHGQRDVGRGGTGFHSCCPQAKSADRVSEAVWVQLTSGPFSADSGHSSALPSCPPGRAQTSPPPVIVSPK